MSERRDRTLGAAVQRIGEAKKLAADARNAAKRGEPPAGPPPKEVYAEACQKIGEAFAKDGFSFRKSGPKLVRRDGDFTETIAFQSSMHNVAGVSVSLVCHVSLSSKALRAWRAEVKSPFSNTDFVGGGQLGNIRKPHEWISWNLAEADHQTINSIVAQLREVAMPLFTELRDPSWIVNAGRNGAEVSGLLRPYQVVELLLQADRRADAEVYVKAFLAQRPEVMKNALAMRAQLEQAASVTTGSGYADELARASLHYNLPL